MRNLLVQLRSAGLWTVCWLFFVTAVPGVLVLAAFLGQRRIDFLVRFAAWTIVRLAGARVRVETPPGFDPERTTFFIANHVNLFDPFVLYSAIPTYLRGLELESHFKVPIYGWFMKRFGNVPVPDVRTPAGLKRTYRLAGEALANGVSLIVFPEASRTLDGRVGRFESGVFRMALNLGYAITPVSIVNAFYWKRKESKLLRPATVTVKIHETIEIDGLGRKDLQALRDRAHAIVSGPIDADLDTRAQASV